MEDQPERNEQESTDREKDREAQRDRRMEWVKVAATLLDAASRFLRP